MARVGGMTLIALLVASLFLAFGCDKKTTANEETGIAVTFQHCLDFNTLVWIDDNFVGSYSSGHEAVIEMAAGSHKIYAKSNMIVADTFFCWTTSANVSDGQLTSVVLDCYGHGCR